MAKIRDALNVSKQARRIAVNYLQRSDLAMSKEAVLRKIEKTAFIHGFFGVRSESLAASTGVVNVHPQGSIMPVARVSYDVRPDTYTLRLWVGTRPIPSQPLRDSCFDFHEPARFWEVLKRELADLRKVYE